MIMKTFNEWLEHKHPEFLEEGFGNWARGMVAAGAMLGGGNMANAQTAPTVPQVYKDVSQIKIVSKQPAQKDMTGKPIDMNIKEIGPNHYEVPVIETKGLKKVFDEDTPDDSDKAKTALVTALKSTTMKVSQIKEQNRVKTSDGNIVIIYRMTAVDNKMDKPTVAPKTTVIPDKKVIIDD